MKFYTMIFTPNGKSFMVQMTMLPLRKRFFFSRCCSFTFAARYFNALNSLKSINKEVFFFSNTTNKKMESAKITRLLLGPSECLCLSDTLTLMLSPLLKQECKP